MALQRRIRVGILTASDSAYRGERQDESGPVIASILEKAGMEIVHQKVLPDDEGALAVELKYMADGLGLDVVLTTGGTGLGPRDRTPEATRAVIEREVPGIAEALRAAGLRKTPHAMLSRAVAGVRGSTLIVNLPGSPRAVQENLEVVMPALGHAVELLQGTAVDCARLRR
ncbi:MAG: MogA/MoaB family molybdenum cofactor biosynthesis protein [Bacillota bacterium]|nr:MogA/MoaB family molybdenum cofactor biosynthesis protein [Bacillota bacterium]MDI7250726.1 MogA/MoaB family molybdenum cofactor biosynthesis protein [Bacillota bacterium]